MSQLPADVLFTVLGFAYARPEPSAARKYTFKTRRAWFASTFLVASAWYAAGQPILYRRIAVSFQEDWQFDSLLRTLTSSNGAAEETLAQKIHELFIGNHRHEVIPEYEKAFPVPGIPIITQKGRRGWRRKRKYDKLRRLLGICFSLKRLEVYAIHISKLAPALEELWVRHRRLEHLEVYDMNSKFHTLWSDLAQFTFWSHLPALTIHASPNHRTYGNPSWKLVDLPLPLKGGRLMSLEIFAHVHAGVLQDILLSASLTLRTLICNETIQIFSDQINATTFGPVAKTLTSLTLTLESIDKLGNISSMTALICLTLVLKSCERQLPRGRPLSMCVFPPNLQTIEWRAKAGVDPWILAERVRDTLHAFDGDRLVGLRSIIVTATLQSSKEVSLWTILAALLQGITKTRT